MYIFRRHLVLRNTFYVPNCLDGQRYTSMLCILYFYIFLILKSRWMLLLKIRILEYQIMVYYDSIKEVPHAPILHRPVQISLILIVITNKIIV